MWNSASKREMKRMDVRSYLRSSHYSRLICITQFYAPLDDQHLTRKTSLWSDDSRQLLSWEEAPQYVHGHCSLQCTGLSVHSKGMIKVVCQFLCQHVQGSLCLQQTWVSNAPQTKGTKPVGGARLSIKLVAMYEFDIDSKTYLSKP